jgi:hypothetical protein
MLCMQPPLRHCCTAGASIDLPGNACAKTDREKNSSDCVWENVGNSIDINGVLGGSLQFILVLHVYQTNQTKDLFERNSRRLSNDISIA